jgi:hypothetical protein
MSTPIVSAEAKARLTEAVKNYTPPAPEKYRVLEEVRESIAELRSKKASYHTIHALLHDTAGIEVSHQTIARYCREVLGPKQVRKTVKKSGAPAPAKSSPAALATKTTPRGQSSPAQPKSLSQTSAMSKTAAPQTNTPISSQSSHYRTRGPHIAHVELIDGTTT